MDDQSIIQPIIETEEQKKARANICMAEIQETLKKHDCEFKVTITLSSHNDNSFLVNVTTK